MRVEEAEAQHELKHGTRSAVADQARSAKEQHELLPFVAVWAVQFQKDCGLNGLHPHHYDLMVKYGARMVDFKRATNAEERLMPITE